MVICEWEFILIKLSRKFNASELLFDKNRSSMVLKNLSLILINLLCAIFLIDLLCAMRLVKLFVLRHTQSAVTPKIKIVSRTRWFLSAIGASKLYLSVAGYSIIHNHLGENQESVCGTGGCLSSLLNYH